MSDPLPGRPGRSQRAGAESDKRTLFERLVEFLSPGPDSRAELIETLADAEQRSLIEPESRAMLEGVLRMADRTAGDVMVAAPRMDLLAIDAPYDELLAAVIGTGHSRFPVYEGQRDNIIGTLMAKDLPDLPGKEAMVYIVEYPPGTNNSPHRHNGHVFLHILEGQLNAQIKGGELTVLNPGDTYYESPTDIHVISRNPSSSTPAKAMVFLIHDKGAALSTPVKN